MEDDDSLTGRKIPPELENPFDNLVIWLAQTVNYFVFIRLGFHPNLVTILSLISGLYSAWLFHYEIYVWSAFFFLLAYLLDCCDGNLARSQAKVSQFGDWLDHMSDLTKTLAVVIAVLAHPMGFLHKLNFLVILSLLLWLSFIHLSNQEKKCKATHGGQSPSLGYLKSLRIRGFGISLSRFFGLGTFVLWLSSYLLHFKMRFNNLNETQ